MTDHQAEEALAFLLATPYPREGADVPSVAVFDAVDALIAALGSDDVAPTLLNAVRAGRTSAELAAAYIEIAMWSGTDNGAASAKTMQSWLECPKDRGAVELALLHMANARCLLSPATRRVEVLGLVAERFPDLRAQCLALIHQWECLPNGE